MFVCRLLTYLFSCAAVHFFSCARGSRGAGFPPAFCREVLGSMFNEIKMRIHYSVYIPTFGLVQCIHTFYFCAWAGVGRRIKQHTILHRVCTHIRAGCRDTHTYVGVVRLVVLSFCLLMLCRMSFLPMTYTRVGDKGNDNKR